MSQGCLIDKSARSYAVYYCVLQFMYIAWMISNMHRSMSYHVNEFNVDPSKLIRISKLWNVLQISNSKNFHDNTSYTQMVDIPDRLERILSEYRIQNSNAIHIYTGMFDSHLVFHSKVGEFLDEQLQIAYPFKLSIDSLDSIVLVYSIGLLCYAILYTSLISKIESNTGLGETESITVEKLTEDVLLFDTFFWVILLCVIYITIDISMPVSNSYVTFWMSQIYVILLYNACITADMARFSRFVITTAWFMHAMILSACM
jgi:hypothetical protein